MRVDYVQSDRPSDKIPGPYNYRRQLLGSQVCPQNATVRAFVVRCAGLILLTMAAVSSNAQHVSSGSVPVPAPAARNHAIIATNYGKLPLSFEENQGQINPQVRFLSRGNGYSLFLTDSAAVLSLRKPEASLSSGLASTAGVSFRRAAKQSASFKTDVIRMELAGASHDLHVIGDSQLSGTANYFIGNDPEKWHRAIPTYARVKYDHVYPGIDLVYYGNQGQLEYDFVVAPNADPKPIRLHFAGASKLKVDKNGDLEVIARNGRVSFHAPVVYQEITGKRVAVSGRFTLKTSREAGFAIGAYDRTRPLVIDPTLSYSTYLGGSDGLSYGTAIAVDGTGSAYVTGVVYATDFPATSGAYQMLNKGSSSFDAFVAKLNPNGTALLYATYLGGSGNSSVAGTLNHGDYPTGIRVDGSGSAYVSGIAYSTDFPVTSGAFQMTNKGGPNGVSNGFVTKINAAGSGLVYSTYLGGTGITGYAGQASLGDTGGDGCASIAIDASGDAFVTGTAYSTDFPLAGSSYQTMNHASGSRHPNAFAAKLNPQGNAIVYSTYLGGSTGDGGSGIAVDSSGNAYIDGATYSTDFPTSGNALQGSNNAGASVGSNAFVTKLNSTGSSLLYSTYLGGSGNPGGPGGNNNADVALSIALDSAENAYLFGLTSSGDFPVSAGALQSVNNAYAKGGPDYFIAKVNPSGSGLIYSTYLGGSLATLNAGSAGLAVDPNGDVYVTGYVLGSDYPVSSNAYQSTPACALVTDGSLIEYASPVFSEINPNGTALLYSTYFGGSGGPVNSIEGVSQRNCDLGYGVALDSQADLYLTGSAVSANFPTTPGAYQTTNPANGSAYISKFLLNSNASTISTTTALTASSDPAAVGTSVTFTATVMPGTGNGVPGGTVTFSVDGGTDNAVPINSSAQATLVTSTLTAGTHAIKASYSGDSAYAASITSLSESVTASSSGTAATPTFSPSAGTYSSTQTVTISDATAGAAIYFTIDGTTPTTSSSLYSSPISVVSSETIQAIATASGYGNSAVASAAYVINAGSSSAGVITTYTGDGTKGFTGDGSAATDAELATPWRVAVDRTGNVYIADTFNSVIRKVSAATGIISTVAGNQTPGYSGDGGLATNAELNYPYGIAVDSAGNLYIADSVNHRIREVNAVTGIITTVAGNGTAGNSGDGGPATSAELTYPYGMAVDSAGNLYTADWINNRIRKVTAATGMISTVAGNGTEAYSGDGGPATSAGLYFPVDVAVDSAGNVYVADTDHYVIREVNAATGVITTFAGNGTFGNSGDGGAATSAQLSFPEGLAIDKDDNLYIADSYTNVVRKVTTATRIMTTVVGNGTAGESGDGGPATNAEINTPEGVAVDRSSGSLFIADATNNRIREVQFQVSAPNFSPAAGTYPSAQSVAISDATAGATIYYTTDGSAPTTTSTKYTGPITVSSSETLQALATASGYTNSTVSSAVYKINLPAPTLGVVSGSGQSAAYGSVFASPLVVVIKDSSGNPVSGVVVTFSGTGLKFSATSATTGSNGQASVMATAIAAGSLTVSASASGTTGTASFSLTATPVALTVTATSISVPFGQAIPTLTYITTGFVNGDSSSVVTGSPAETTTATQTSAVGTYPLTISAGTLAAANYSFAFVDGTVTITSLGTTATPTFTPAAGTYTSAQPVVISDTTPGAVIYYTTNGIAPTTASTKYTSPIDVASTETIEAIAVAPGYGNSSLASALYTVNIQPPTAATPTFSPAAGTFTSMQSVTISDTTAGAMIYYTTDGSTPTTSSTKYTGAITVGSSETISAITIASGYANSAVGKAQYVINLPTADFSIGLSSGTLTLTSGQSATVTLTATPANGFSQAITFSCFGLPSNDSCKFSPATITPSGAPATTTLTVSESTTAASHTPFALLPGAPGGTLAMTFCWLSWKRRRKIGSVLFALALMIGLSTSLGCGGGTSSTTSPPKTTYNATITATSGSLSHTTPLIITQ